MLGLVVTRLLGGPLLGPCPPRVHNVIILGKLNFLGTVTIWQLACAVMLSAPLCRQRGSPHFGLYFAIYEDNYEDQNCLEGD